ncbi:MAG: tetratricopeptide repeat protein [Candidatus Eremiobacteraeota bacterium]|nr:tetratricopeptide repeat protein [Candidatus Eremiobacteraeota bacterium]
METNSAWEERMAALWDALDDYEPDEFLQRVKALAAERPPEDAVASFELASANDSIGRPKEAVALYRHALASGLDAQRRRRAVIQLASTLRNLGQPEESVALLTTERDAESDELDDAVLAFLALALVDAGRVKEATGVALSALSRYLPRYNRSLRNYARELIEAT